MKLVNLLLLFILGTGIAFTSCKSKTPKELIVSKWKFIDFTGGSSGEMPDSIKTKMINNAVLEFMADNKYSLTGIQGVSKTGIFAISDDGKILTMTPDDTKTAEADSVSELSGSKLVITDRFGTKLTCTH